MRHFTHKTPDGKIHSLYIKPQPVANPKREGTWFADEGLSDLQTPLMHIDAIHKVIGGKVVRRFVILKTSTRMREPKDYDTFEAAVEEVVKLWEEVLNDR